MHKSLKFCALYGDNIKDMTNLNDILLLQKRELELIKKSNYVERDTSIKELKKNIIKVIIGPRRAGKSFFVLKELLKIGNFGYVNFDDETILNYDYNDIIVSVNSIYNNPSMLFFDEIQNLPKWELFVNRIQRQGYNVILSGSNANLLGTELATHLTGRYIQTIIFPFSFKEYIKFSGTNLTESEIKEKLNEYIQNGGYPEPLTKNLSYRDYLKTLIESILYKDIVKRYNIRNTTVIENLVKYIISNAANLFSYQSITRLTNIKSVHTIEKYIKFFEETFLMFKLNSCSYKIKTQIKSPKKIYVMDNGLITSLGFSFSPDVGRLYENVVAIELKKMELKGKLNLYYYRNPQKYEVDFIIQKNNKIEQLIQVCYDISDEKTKKREINALLYASEELKCKNLLIITSNYEREENVKWFNKVGKIKFIPLWKWLYNNQSS